MVCIHSGAFLRGESTECFPTYFMDKRIVMVSFDYRLGLLGKKFLISECTYFQRPQKYPTDEHSTLKEMN